jgi:hypothetical protein
MSLSTVLQLEAQDVYETSSTKVHELGAKAVTSGGRVYRYAQAGAVNLAAGKVTVTPAKVSNHTNIAVAAAAALGATEVSVTLGATAATADQYVDGFLVVIDSTGAGQTMRIRGHVAIASGGTGSIYLKEPLQVALTTSSKVSLVYNPWASTVISPNATGVSQVCNGVPNVAVTAAYYYWSQTGGIASVLSDGVIAKGAGAILSDAVDGALETEVAGTVTQRVATAPEATVDAKYYPLYLTLDKGE